MNRIEVPTQIQRGMRVLAHYGTVVLDPDVGVLALYDSNNELIDHAPVDDVDAKTNWWLFGVGCWLRLGPGRRRYYVSLRTLSAGLRAMGNRGGVQQITKEFRAELEAARFHASHRAARRAGR